MKLPALLLAIFVVSTCWFEAHAQNAPDFSGSGACRDCHSDIFKAWQTSHHAKAWTLPSADTIQDNFNNEVFSHRGRTSLFFRDGDRFLIETTDLEGSAKTFDVKGIVGTEPLRQYLVETAPGRLQPFDLAWDVDRKTWYHLYPDQPLPPEDAFHWTGPYKTWNARCAECHATGFSKDYDARSRTYQSHQQEIGVGCESCHGPASMHVAWARGNQHGTENQLSDSQDPGFALRLGKADADTQIQQCAGCHSRREPFLQGNPLPGTPFHDAHRLALLRDGLYHPDGQILDEVYVLGSFLQSKMYQKGVRCSDCHDPHTAELKASGTALCTQCHSPAGNTAFPTLAKKNYDDPEHTFHAPDTEGAQCVSCHMIERVYMGVDGRRDHSFRVPRPDVSVRTGAPNACNDCHTDQTAAWAAAQLEERFPDSRFRGSHFADTFQEARTRGDGLAAPLLKIALRDTFPAIVRATALDLLRGRVPVPDTSSIKTLLQDPDPLVRAATAAHLGAVAGQERLNLFQELLTDPVKSVRIAAARALLNNWPTSQSKELRAAAGRANAEWQQTLGARLDFPETHMVIGGTALALRNPRAAIRAFQEATLLDPQLLDAWIMQIRIHLSLGDGASAERTLQRALQELPDNHILNSLKTQLTNR